MPACESVNELERRLAIQSGESEHTSNPNWSLVYFLPGSGFGSKVELVFHDSPSELGYLMTLPPRRDPDIDGVIHMPSTFGEKDDAGPKWITIADATELPGIKAIIVGC